MRNTVLILLFSALQAFATGSYAQTKKISLAMNDATIREVLYAIQKQSEFYFLYNSELIDVAKKVNITIEEEKVDGILTRLFNKNEVDFLIRDRYIVLTPVGGNAELFAEQQQRTVSGKVIDYSGLPLPGVTVVVKGTTQGTVTNADGNYSLTIIPEDATLVFSFVGMQTQEVEVGNQSTIDVMMVVDAIGIEEVVAVGYGIQKKVNLTGSLASVSGEELAKTPVANVTNALAGRLPGLYVKNTSGAPGKNDAVSFNIRGFGAPLIILDGIPISSEQLAGLNSNDIESMNILKDAAAAAVYGARAGNGVILITTKRGITEKPQFLFTSNFGLQSFTKKPKLASSAQYAELQNIARFNEERDPIYTAEQIQKYRDGTDPAYPNTDWWRLTFSDFAPQFKNDLNIRGGSENIKFFVSGGHLKQEGMLRSGDMDYNRYNLRTNIDVKLTKKLDMGLDVGFMLHDYIGPAYDVARPKGWSIGIMSAVLRSRPFYPSEFPNKDIIPFSGTDIGNPVYHSQIDYAGYMKDNNLYADAKLKVKYQLPFGIMFNALFDYNRFYKRQKIRTKQYEFFEYDWAADKYDSFGFSWFRMDYTSNPKALQESYSLDEAINLQYSLDWAKKIGDHNISALAVFEINEENYEFFTAWRENYENDIEFLDAGPDENKSNSGTGSEFGRMGYIGRVNYDYKGKYLFEFNARYDGSVNFPEDTRWGFFPSASLAWRIAEESFIKENYPFVDNLKIRASYGVLGYDNVSRFQYLSTYRLSSKIFIDGELESGIRINNLPNPNITWETMTTKNIGLDLSLWHGKLSAQFDYFYRLRSDVLRNRILSMPNVVGASLPAVNYAEFDTRGFELELGHQNKIGNDFYYQVGANLTWTRSKTIYIDQREFVNELDRWRNDRNGKWTDRWWGYESDGLFQSEEEIRNWADQDGKNNATILPGDIKYVDQNGDGRITGDDFTLIGKGTFPQLFYGINADLNYKGFDLGMLFQGAGHYNVDRRRINDIFSPFYAGIMMRDFWRTDAWTPETPWSEANPNGQFPRYREDNMNRNHPNWRNNSDFWLISGNYIRLKNLEVGYTLPSHLLQKYGIGKCRIHISGNNFFTLSKVKIVDPEIFEGGFAGNYYPQVKVYNIGVTISF